MSYGEGKPATELSKETLDLIRFLVKDSAFDVEFLVTAIQEYFQSNRKEQK